MPNKANILLRNYQKDIVVRVHEAWMHQRSVMVQMPTGTGKTHVLAQIVHDFEGQVLIVAHRIELVEQIRDTLRAFQTKAYVESIQTVARRMEHLEYEPELVIVDEAHHALARTYRGLWEKWPKAKFLGLTATPCRMNRSGFTDLFDTLVASWSIEEFIQKGVLSTFEYVSVQPDSVELQLIDSLTKRGADGDYQVKEMDAVLNKHTNIERLYRSLMQQAEGKKGIVYAISIDHARKIAEHYSQKGIRAVAIDSQTPKEERKRMVEAFKKGDIQVMVNVDVFSEGFDCPDVEFVQLARPTLSLSKYLQQVGRGLRKSNGKESCVMIDNVGLSLVFGLPTQAWDWERMFRGEYDLSEEERKAPLRAWQDEETGRWGLRRGRMKMTEAIFISIFDIKENLAAVRFENCDCGLTDDSGRVIWRRRPAVSMKMGRNRLMEVELEGGKRNYVDLCNLKSYTSPPEIKRYGDFELLIVNRRCYSRTKRPYASQQDFENLLITHKDFLLSIHESKGSFSLEDKKRFALLKGDPDEYYRIERWLPDGSVALSDLQGNYYQVTKLGEKTCIGPCPTAIDRLEEEVKRKMETEQQQKTQRIFEDLRQAEPYRCGVKWGLKVGNRITVPPIYRQVGTPIGKYCAVEKNYDQWGIIRIDGSVLIEPKYAKVSIEANGTALLTQVTGKTVTIQLT